MPNLDPRLAELLRQLRGGALPQVVPQPQPVQPHPAGPGRPVDTPQPARPKLPGERPP